VVLNPEELISDFALVMKEAYSRSLISGLIQHDLIRAPHAPPNLPMGKCGIYVFSLASGSTAKAGPNRTLKVGRIGANSGPRFKYQHYKSGSAKSTVAGALENNLLLWTYLGVPKDTIDIGQWLKQNTDRDHFLLDRQSDELVPLLEVYLKGVLGPVLEGSLKSHAAELLEGDL
jgi:hypothetical protein